MKKIISILIIVVLLASFSQISFSADSNDYTIREDFLWGINSHHFDYESYPEQKLEEQILLCAQLGSDIVRFNYSSTDRLDYLDHVVGLVNKYGMKLMLVCTPPLDGDLEYARILFNTFAERYNGKDGRGKIDYFQIYNETEIDLMRAKLGEAGADGTVLDHYFTTTVDGELDLPEMMSYFQAAIDGIRSADTDAKIVVNFCSTHWGAMKYYVQNNLDFDIIGWDWYATKNNTALDSEEFVQCLADFRKEFPDKEVIFCETNGFIEAGITNGNSLFHYNSLLNNMKHMYSQDWVKGCIVYELLDQPALGEDNRESIFGIVNCGRMGEIGEPKPIYLEIQKMFKGNPELKGITLDSIDFTPYNKLVVDTTDDSNVNIEEEVTNDSNVNIEEEVTNENDDIIDEPIEFMPSDDVEIPESIFFEEPDTETEVVYEDVVKNMVVTKTDYRMPWTFLILCSCGLLVIAAAIIVIYLYIQHRKLKGCGVFGKKTY